VAFEEKTYIYADFFEQKTSNIPITKSVALFEKSEGIDYSLGNGELSLSGKHGYAVFIEE